jgi:hypothetical protein
MGVVSGQKFVGFYCEPGAARLLRIEAVTRGVSFSALVKEALAEWWARQGRGEALFAEGGEEKRSSPSATPPPDQVAETPPGEKRSSRSMPSASTREIGKKGGEGARSSEGDAPPPARKGAKAKGRG